MKTSIISKSVTFSCYSTEHVCSVDHQHRRRLRCYLLLVCPWVRKLLQTRIRIKIWRLWKFENPHMGQILDPLFSVIPYDDQIAHSKRWGREGVGRPREINNAYRSCVGHIFWVDRNTIQILFKWM